MVNALAFNELFRLSDTHKATLAGLGIADAQHLLGVLSVPGIADHIDIELKLGAIGLQELHREARLKVGYDIPPSTRQFGMGAIESKSLSRSRSNALTTIGSFNTPPSFDLISNLGPIRDQGSRGTCVAFAFTVLNEFKWKNSGSNDLSEQILYYFIKKSDGRRYCGSSLNDGHFAAFVYGQCDEARCPYISNMPCNNHGIISKAARNFAAKRRMWATVSRKIQISGLKNVLARLRRPFVTSIPVYGSWYYSGAVVASGDINMRIGNEPKVGGHAFAIVGYKDGPEPGGGHFIVRNSWGTDWAFDSQYAPGYGTIPYAYLVKYGWEVAAWDPEYERVGKISVR